MNMALTCKNHAVTLLLGMCSLGFLNAALVAAAPASGPTLYVSTQGRDSWSGRLAQPNAGGTDGPLATLAAARDQLRRTGAAGGARVVIRGGTYHLDEPLHFTAADSGVEGAPRSYEAYSGEKVVIAGTRALGGPWQSIGRNLYVNDVAELVGSGASFRTLFVDGKRATWARYPNAGFLHAADGKGRTVIVLPPGTAKQAWSEDPAAKVNIVAEKGWYNEIANIKAIGAAGDTIELSGRELVGKILPQNRFFIQGVRSELDVEGEWYLDRQAAKLYYFSAGAPAERRFEAAVVDRLIDVRGSVAQPVRHLAFRGLEFFGSDFTFDHVAVRTNQDAAIHLVNARNIEIAECRFVASGGYAVWLHLDSRDNIIRRNEVVEGGAGGVLVTGARFSYLSGADLYDPSPDVQQVAPVGNVIAENHIHHGGLVREYCSGIHLDSRPLALARERGNYVGFNHIHDMPRNGVFVFRNQGGNIIEANHIHDVLQRTNDGGAIHLASMNPLSAPTHIVDNRIYRVGYQGGDAKVRLAFGIYPDWFTSHMTIRGNIVSDTRDGGIRLLGGSDTVIEDNVVGDDPAASVVFGSWMTNSVSGLVLRGNTIVNGQGEWVRYYTGGTGPAIDRVVQQPSAYWTSTRNIYWGRGTGGGIAIARSQRDALRPGDRKLGLAEMQERGADHDSVERDPGANGRVDTSTSPERFGLGSETIERMQRPRPTSEARAWLERLAGVATFVSFDDPARVTHSKGWQAEPTMINEGLAFADLKQATARAVGETITFSADLRPGTYAVHVQWYGDPADRGPRLDLELAAPGAPTQSLQIDHHQEAHKWIKVGVVEAKVAAGAVVKAINPGGGMTAINAVAWVRQQQQ